MVPVNDKNSSISGGVDSDALNSCEQSVTHFDPRSPDCVNQLRFTVIGLVFLVFGVVPGFYGGKYGFSVLFQQIFGRSTETNVYVDSVIAVGSVIGVIAAAILSVLAAALLCRVTRSLTSLFASRVEEDTVKVLPVRGQGL